MRIRSIKPEFWRSEDVSRCSIEDRLLFIGLWSYVDDNGVGKDSLATVTADLFADDLARDSSETFARVSRGLAHLSAAGLIARYTVENRAYLYILTWEKHQRIDRPGKPRYPLPTRADTEFATDSRDTREDAATGAGEQGSRGAVEQGAVDPLPTVGGAAQARPRATRLPEDWRPPPNVIDEIRAECPTVDLASEHRKFTDYWKAKPGKDGTKLDWPATWRNWIRKAAETKQITNGKPRRQAETDEMFAAAMDRALAADQRKAVNQ